MFFNFDNLIVVRAVGRLIAGGRIVFFFFLASRVDGDLLVFLNHVLEVKEVAWS